MPRSAVVPPLSALLLVAPFAIAGAQNPAGSVVVRTPNMFTGWVADPATLQFNFVHRFTESGPPEHQISNSPTFFVAAGLPARTTVGFAYSTSSDVAPRRPNEWEFFGRVMPFTPGNKIVDVTLHGGYNWGAASTDGELGLTRQVGPLRLLAAGRAFSNAFRAGEGRTAVAGGVNVRLARWLAAAGDMSSLMNRRDGERIAWSGGLLIGIPTTPHSFSIHATNANTGTLEGASRGTRRTRWGFEYTVPITLARYIPALRPRTQAEPVAAAADTTAAPTAAPPAAAPAAAAPPAAEPPTAAPPTSAPIPVQKEAAPAAPPTAAAPAAPSVSPAAPRASAPPARPAPTKRDTVRVTMKQLEFAPARIEVAAGTTVTWTNTASLIHTVVADDNSFASGDIGVGKRWSHTFTKPGTYPFHCTPHPFMKGVVVVR